MAHFALTGATILLLHLLRQKPWLSQQAYPHSVMQTLQLGSDRAHGHGMLCDICLADLEVSNIYRHMLLTLQLTRH